MKVLFLHPIPLHITWPIPIDFVKYLIYNPPSVTFPQLAACVPGHDCRLLDGMVESPNIKEFTAIIKDRDVVAITVPSNLVSLNAELNINLIRRIKPEIKIIVGGLHASVYDQQWLEKGADFVIRKDGEWTFKELVNTIEQRRDFSKIQGLSYIADGKITVNPDRPFIANLDQVPVPRWEIVDYSKYKNFFKGGYVGTVETSRGCTAECDFCMASEVWNHIQRFKSADRVIEEMRRLKELGVNRLYLTDDNFGADVKRDTEICRRMIQERFNFKWSCFARADYIMGNPEFYELAAQAGLEAVLVGLETLSMKNLSFFNKGYKENTINSLSDYENNYNFLKKNRIFTLGLFVIGHPNEEEGEIKYTLINYKRVCDFPFFTPFRPETEKYIVSSGKERKSFFYFNSLAIYEDKKKYQKLRIWVTIGSFMRFSNIVRAFFGTYFEKSFFRGLYVGLLKGIANFHKRLPGDILSIIQSPDGFTSQVYERYAKDFLQYEGKK